MTEYEVMLSGDYSYTILVEAISKEEAEKLAKEEFEEDRNQIDPKFYIVDPEYTDIY